MPAPKKQESKPAETQRSLLKLAMAGKLGEEVARDDILDIIFWFRQFVGLVIGVVAGLLKLQGALVFVVFGVSVYLGTILYYSKFLEIDDQDFND